MLLHKLSGIDQVVDIRYYVVVCFSAPAPGYFNDDDVLDFMVHWNTGSWMSYSNSNVSQLQTMSFLYKLLILFKFYFSLNRVERMKPETAQLPKA